MVTDSPTKIRDGPTASHNHVGHEKLSVLDERSGLVSLNKNTNNESFYRLVDLMDWSDGKAEDPQCRRPGEKL
jgi:hypothetical protein